MDSLENKEILKSLFGLRGSGGKIEYMEAYFSLPYSTCPPLWPNISLLYYTPLFPSIQTDHNLPEV